VSVGVIDQAQALEPVVGPHTQTEREREREKHRHTHVNTIKQ